MAAGRPGRPRTPDNVRELRGQPRRRPDGKVAPKPPPSVAEVVAPDYLDDEQRAVWDRLAPSLIARGVLTAWDVDTFAVLCASVVLHRRAVALVNQSNVLVGPAGGRGSRVAKNPALQVVRDQASIIATFAGRFGLTPSDRAHIDLPPDTGSDSWILD